MEQLVDIDSMVKHYGSRLPSMEAALGKGLYNPFNASNSGVRKLMNAIHQEHAIRLERPEIPYCESGYEQEFGKYSSSVIRAKGDYEVLAKINKFELVPDEGHDHYFLIVKDTTNNCFRYIERVDYKHKTERYGYSFNNDYLDTLHENSVIPKGKVIKKSKAYNEFNDRMDGVNLLSCTLTSLDSMEDCINISQSAAKKFDASLYHKLEIHMNTNDIMLNLYGDDNEYRGLPWIGEKIKDGVVCSLRRENKEEMLFSQSKDMLKKMMPSDECFMVEDEIIDIDLQVNSPELLDLYYNSQLKLIYEDQLRFAKAIVDTMDSIMNEEVRNGLGEISVGDITPMDHDLEFLYDRSQALLAGTKYVVRNSTVFSGIKIILHVKAVSKLEDGHKITNRFGGKGVVKIVPDEFMPQLPDGTPIEMILNKFSVPNRENFGFLWECEVNFYSRKIIEAMNNISTVRSSKKLDVNDYIQLIYKFYHILNPELAEHFLDVMESMTEDEIITFLSDVLNSHAINISLKPIRDNMTIDKSIELQQAFPWIQQERLLMPLVGTDGKIRYRRSARPMMASYTYAYRLKQISEDKFSATALASINIKGENSKNKANKYYKLAWSDTPVRNGNMELQDMQHMTLWDSEILVKLLLTYSTSPEARDAFGSLLFGSVVDTNIDLRPDVASRSVQQFNIFFKVLGIKFKYKWKIKNTVTPFAFMPFGPRPAKAKVVPFFLTKSESQEFKNIKTDEDLKKYMKEVVPFRLIPFERFEYPVGIIKSPEERMELDMHYLEAEERHQKYREQKAKETDKKWITNLTAR